MVKSEWALEMGLALGKTEDELKNKEYEKKCTGTTDNSTYYNFLSFFTGNYTGFYAGSRNYTGNYASNFSGTYSSNFSGATVIATKETVSTIKLWVRTA